MQSREIQEAFRKGNMNEKQIAHFLVVLNEKHDALQKDVAKLVQTVVQMSSLMSEHAEANMVMSTWIGNLRKKLGEVDVSSESIEDRVRVSEDLQSGS